MAPGCWHDAMYVSTSTWADDDSHIVYSRLFFEEQRQSPGSGSTSKRNYHFELWKMDATANGDSVLLFEDSGLPLSNPPLLFSYPVIESIMFLRAEDDDYVSYDVHVLNTGTNELVTLDRYDASVPELSGGQLFMLPSPNGQLIATIRFLSDKNQTPSGYKIRFYQYPDWKMVSEDVGTALLDGYTWNREGSGLFLLANNQVSLLDVQTAGVTPAIRFPACFNPATTSWVFSDTGEFLVWQNETDTFEIKQQENWQAFEEIPYVRNTDDMKCLQ